MRAVRYGKRQPRCPAHAAAPRSPLSRRTELSLFAASDRNTVGPVDQTASPWRTEDTHRMVGTTRFHQQGPFSAIAAVITRRRRRRAVIQSPSPLVGEGLWKLIR